MKTQPHNIINTTKEHFSKYVTGEMQDIDAVEIVKNFSGFAKLIIKLEQKRQKNMETQHEQKTNKSRKRT